MQNFCVGLTFIFSVTALAADDADKKADPPAIKVGDEAPEFELKGSDGKTYKSADLKGKTPYVIAWYPKAFTGG
jgi:cytochrome oxidase Cu insertion factor (SCO1/SenC/PrrC family)